MFSHDLRIDLDTDQEEEQDESNSSDKVEARHGSLWKDCCREIGDPAHDGRPEDNATHDFGNDFWLSGEGEDVAEALGEKEDDDDLDDEDRNGLLVSSDICLI